MSKTIDLDIDRSRPFKFIHDYPAMTVFGLGQCKACGNWDRIEYLHPYTECPICPRCMGMNETDRESYLNPGVHWEYQHRLHREFYGNMDKWEGWLTQFYPNGYTAR